jgi:hypothetical protein
MMRVKVNIPPDVSITMGCGLFTSQDVPLGDLGPYLDRESLRDLSYLLMKGGALYAGPSTEPGELQLFEVEDAYRGLDAWTAQCLRIHLQAFRSTYGGPAEHFAALRTRFEQEGAASLLTRQGASEEGLTVERVRRALTGIYELPAGLAYLVNSWNGSLESLCRGLVEARDALNAAEREEVKQLYLDAPKPQFSSEEWKYLERIVERFR